MERHATESCRQSFSQVHRHGAEQKVSAYDLLRKAGCTTTFEDPMLIPLTRARPVDVYVPVPPGKASEMTTHTKPKAYCEKRRSTVGRIFTTAKQVHACARQCTACQHVEGWPTWRAHTGVRGFGSKFHAIWRTRARDLARTCVAALMAPGRLLEIIGRSV